MRYLPTVMYYKAYWNIRLLKLQDLIASARYSIKECLKNGDKVYLREYREELNRLQYAFPLDPQSLINLKAITFNCFQYPERLVIDKGVKGFKIAVIEVFRNLL